MMNEKLILKHLKNKNPYGLINDDGEAITRNETIAYFNQLEITDEELESLNQWIGLDKRHTIHDNAFLVWDERGYEMDYITGYRLSPEMTIEFKCHYDKSSWIGSITDFKEYQGYKGFTVHGRGSKIKVYMGKADDELWICFPVEKVSTTLSSPNNLFWNTEEIARLFNSAIDGTTVALAIKEIETNPYFK